MQNLLPLNDLFRQYAWGDMDKKKLEGRIFEYVLTNYRRFCVYDWDKDEYADYLCWLYPRMSRAIDNYQETGSSFEAYIGALVRWSAREYRSRLADHHITESAAWTLRLSELPVHNSEPEYPQPEQQREKVVNPRQILLLLLKSYYFVSEDFIGRIAPCLGMEKEELGGIVHKLRELRTDRDEEIRGLRERIHCQFYRCITFEKRLNAVPESSAHYAKMKSRLARARVRLGAMRKRLAGIRLDATNRQIAEVLGIPKGTVDSNLSALRQRMRRISRKGRKKTEKAAKKP
jgi:DNA-directed RNA polymerase specialized sigma24 family protein